MISTNIKMGAMTFNFVPSKEEILKAAFGALADSCETAGRFSFTLGNLELEMEVRVVSPHNHFVVWKGTKDVAAGGGGVNGIFCTSSELIEAFEAEIKNA